MKSPSIETYKRSNTLSDFPGLNQFKSPILIAEKIIHFLNRHPFFCRPIVFRSTCRHWDKFLSAQEPIRTEKEYYEFSPGLIVPSHPHLCRLVDVGERCVQE